MNTLKKLFARLCEPDRAGSIALAMALSCTAALTLAAQPGDRAPAVTPSARSQAPYDLTGYWVSVVTQDWRYRMVVPGKGEYQGIPIKPAAKEFADSWNPSTEEAAGQACKAYGVGLLMWTPGRLHITWQDDNTLRVDADAGTQTRLLRFKPSPEDAAAPASVQGLSVASWVGHRQSLDSLKVSTSHVSPGLLRRNGLPYGGQMSMTEYWDQYQGPGGQQWLVIATELEDPQYLEAPYDFVPMFKKEADGSKWDPSPCSLR
jgi:hypothetical protein